VGDPPEADETLMLPTLEVTGELDLAVAPWLRDQLDALFVGGADSIVVDLTIAGLNDQFTLYQDRAGLPRAKGEQ
jgi:hypothetical protein